MSEGLWSLLGVVVGFGLAELTQWLKSLRGNRVLRAALNAELDAIIRMIPHKVDIIGQAERALQSSQIRILNTTSTHFPRQIYDRIIETAPELLTPSERDALHVLHERLRVTDTLMDGMEDRFNSMTTAQSIRVAVQAAIGTLHDLKSGLEQSGEIASSIVGGKPLDVYPSTGT